MTEDNKGMLDLKQVLDPTDERGFFSGKLLDEYEVNVCNGARFSDNGFVELNIEGVI